ncbi:MAG: SAM-dependent methyltransferase [marine bacterium B5-7]|nr:MAG: SAM-dependent methyltransferase [marine bacterium B5-7]
MKQYAPAFERNRQPITDALIQALDGCSRLLEIGSGTGQHVAWFAREFPSITFYPSDLPTSIDSIEAWREEAGLDNIQPARVIDLLSEPASEISGINPDAIISINTLHIVSWQGVEALFATASRTLPPGGVLFVYGPFKFKSRALEPSNIEFDRWLKERDSNSGIRCFEDVNQLASDARLECVAKRAMPANNHSIWWRKLSN